MYSATILSVEENKSNPDQISLIVEYSNEEKKFTRQYDWISNTVNEDTADLTIKDELIKMNIDTPTILEILKPKVGLCTSMSKALDKSVQWEVSARIEPIGIKPEPITNIKSE
jgi:hypothetical protein